MKRNGTIILCMAVLLPALMIHGQETASKSTLHLDADSMDATTQRVDGFYGPYALTREASGTSWQPEATPDSGFRFTHAANNKTKNIKHKNENNKSQEDRDNRAIRRISCRHSTSLLDRRSLRMHCVGGIPLREPVPVLGTIFLRYYGGSLLCSNCI